MSEFKLKNLNLTIDEFGITFGDEDKILFPLLDCHMVILALQVSQYVPIRDIAEKVHHALRVWDIDFLILLNSFCSDNKREHFCDGSVYPGAIDMARDRK